MHRCLGCCCCNLEGLRGVSDSSGSIKGLSEAYRQELLKKFLGYDMPLVVLQAFLKTLATARTSLTGTNSQGNKGAPCKKNSAKCGNYGSERGNYVTADCKVPQCVQFPRSQWVSTNAESSNPSLRSFQTTAVPLMLL